MSRSKHTTGILVAVSILMVAVTILFMFGDTLGIQSAKADLPYVDSLFDTSVMHTIDIVVDETQWQGMLDNASAKEYIPVTVVIDGRSVKNVGLRPKGNSSLSTLVMSDSDRYSFKVEFDHYQTGQTYLGLDKLALNNITQDNTYMKDYLSYQMMSSFGAESPLCSYAFITVNGEDWGVYLAVEGIEESFAQRNYGSDYGQIYKPDAMGNMGGGGRDRGNNGGGMPEMPKMPEGMEWPTENGEMPDFAQMMENGEMPDFGAMMGENAPESGEGGRMGGGGGFGGMNSADVALQYIDDDPDSYPNIFDNAVFDVSDADKTRFIAALKQLDSGENLEDAIDVEEVLRYFVVHNFLLNFDSYTGSMLHNYYVREQDGVLSMIAWDYNLSFGGFAMGGRQPGGNDTSASVDNATYLVNFPIDTPLSNGSLEDRPMIGRLLTNETYLEQYHALFAEFIDQFFTQGEFVQLLDDAVALISPYVETDPTAFCTYDEFMQASTELRAFGLLRGQSIEGQLSGDIPATSEGQTADPSALIDASTLSVEALNDNGFGRGDREGGRQMGWGGQAAQETQPAQEQAPPDAQTQAPAEQQAGQAGNEQRMQRGGFPGSFGATQAPQDNTSNYILLAASVVILLAGLLFAFLYGRRR